MKILFFINGIFLGGKERRLLELMKEIKARQQFQFELVVMHPEINYQEVLQLGIKIHYLIRKRKNDISIFRRLYKICKKDKIDIIHCWDSMTAVYALPVCKLLKIKLVNGMVVDTPVKRNILNKHWFRARLTFPFSNIVVGNSKAGLNAYAAPLKKSVCVYNGMDLSRFKNLQNPDCVRHEIFGLSSDSLFIVGMVAAFEIRKDYETVIKAAIDLTSRIDNIRFVLVGAGQFLTQMKESVPLHLRDKIIFLGKRANVENIVNAFDVGILITNSKVHGEGISNSIIEYMFLGKPVIATRGGGTDEIVFNNKNGYLINPNDPAELVEKIELVMKDEERERFGKTGIEMALKKFDLKEMTTNYSRIYENLIQNKN
jgi:glycosyltransferase involved in cell wall biosynthesis